MLSVHAPRPGASPQCDSAANACSEMLTRGVVSGIYHVSRACAGRGVAYVPAAAVEVYRCAGAARLAKAGASFVSETALVARSGVVPVLGCTVLYQNGNVQPGTPRVPEGGRARR